MTKKEAIMIIADQSNGCPGDIVEATNFLMNLQESTVSETEVLKNIQRECKRRFVCTDCRFQEYDEFGFTNCKIHFPEFWILDEQEAAAEDDQDTIPVQSGAEHDMQ